MEVIKRIGDLLGVQIIYLTKQFNFRKRIRWIYLNVYDTAFEQNIINVIQTTTKSKFVKIAVDSFDARTCCIPVAVLMP
jgi:hypothetical protein